MAPGSAIARRLINETGRTRSKDAHVCLSCRHALSIRSYASAASAQSSTESSSTISFSSDVPATASEQQPEIKVKAGVVVSRPPLVTPDPHPFETAYHLYQRRLNERLVLPFTQYFYFRRGTPAYDHWRTHRDRRGGAATRDIGKYDAYSKEGWNDEVVVGDSCAEPSKIVERLVEEEGRAEEFVGESGDVKLAGLRRTTKADADNDQRSLERSLSRTLYLLIKHKPQSKDQPEPSLWRFPSGSLVGKEGLKEAAQRILSSSCGVNMNTWFVGNHPVGHYVKDPTRLKQITDGKKDTKSDLKQETDSTSEVDIEKTFFMKARIFAGQADLKDNKTELQDFKWLTKQEIEKTVAPGYWSKIKNMLVEQ